MRDSTGGVQSALVLGGSSEIGVAIARRLVADRCRRVVLAGRPSPRLDEAAAELRGAGAEVEVVDFDAAATDSHAKVLQTAFDGGDLDVVVLAFGVLGDQDTFDHDPAAAVEAVTVNYTGAVSVGPPRGRPPPAPGPRHAGRAVVGGRGADPARQLRLRLDQGRARRLRPGPGRRPSGHRRPGHGRAPRVRHHPHDRGHGRQPRSRPPRPRSPTTWSRASGAASTPCGRPRCWPLCSAC